MASRAQAWQFAAALVFFHGSEYVLAAAFHGHRNVTATSLLISKQYVLAMSFAMVEHLTESLFFPGIKGHLFVSNIGLLMVLVGEIVRKIAVVTAGRAFTHVIRIEYEDQHQLVTHGIYRFMRHPWVFRLSSMGSWNAGYAVQSSIYSCICFGVVAVLFKADTIRRIFLEAIFWLSIRRICSESALGVTIYKLNVTNLQSNAYPLLSLPVICLRKALYNMDSGKYQTSKLCHGPWVLYNTKRNLEFCEAEESFLSSSICREREELLLV